MLAAALLAGLAAALTPPTADLAAAHFRAELWDRHGWLAYNLAWYGGHHLPSYSLTFPPLAALAGPRAVGLAGAVGGAAAFGALARATLPPQEARIAGLGFAVTLSCGVWIGRMPFTLAVALAAAAGLAAQRGRHRTAVAASALATATSPLAGLFLLLAAAAWWLARRNALRPTAALVLPAVAVAAALAALFPDEGAEWFRASAFWPALAAGVAALAALPRDRSVLRAGAALGCLLLATAFVADTPVGQNAVRPWTLLGAPLLAAVAFTASGRRRIALGAVAAAWAYLALLPAVRAVGEATGDPSARAGFHAELADWLDRHADPGDRVEVPFTRNHWEAAHLALRRPIARGWLRQLDRERNPLFYEGVLTAHAYLHWLDEERIRWVAVPRGVPFDHAGRAEAALVRSGTVPGLGVAARLRGWTVHERRVAPLSGRGRILAADAAGLTLRTEGTVVLPYRHSRWLRGASRGPAGRVLVPGSRSQPFRIGQGPR